MSLFILPLSLSEASSTFVGLEAQALVRSILGPAPILVILSGAKLHRTGNDPGASNRPRPGRVSVCPAPLTASLVLAHHRESQSPARFKPKRQVANPLTRRHNSCPGGGCPCKSHGRKSICSLPLAPCGWMWVEPSIPKGIGPLVKSCPFRGS